MFSEVNTWAEKTRASQIERASFEIHLIFFDTDPQKTVLKCHDNLFMSVCYCAKDDAT